MEPNLLSNTLIDPDENDLDSSLLLSQLLITQFGPKEEEKEEEIQQIPKDQYLCPKCLIPHEIRHINEETKEIEIHCANKCQTKYLIKEYLEHMCRISYYYYKCEICKKKMQKNFKIEEGCIFKYCFECNKIICLPCFDFIHKKYKHKNVVSCNEIFNKCSIHPNEDFVKFCINCSTHLCNKCSLLHHRSHILVNLDTIKPSQKEIDKFKNKKEEYMNKKKELQKQIEDLDNLIYLNEIVLQTYLKHKKNYYYIINVLNLYNNDINKNQNFNNNNINNDDDDNDDDEIINRYKTSNRFRTHYMKKRGLNLQSSENLLMSNSKNLANSNSTMSNSKNLNTSISSINNSKYLTTCNSINNIHKSYNTNTSQVRTINTNSNNDKNNSRTNNKGERKYLRDILSNITKKRGRDNGSSINIFERQSSKIWKNNEDKPWKRRLRNISQEVRSNLDLQEGNKILEKFNKEFGDKPFMDKRKVELWGTKMGKEGLLVLLNNKHKFMELEELVLGRVKLNSIDFLENIFVDKLKLLNLELNRISNLTVFQNLHLVNLEILNLSNNAITSIDILQKIYMPNLLNLNLAKNFIESIDVLSKVNYSKLKILNLAENKISKITVLKNANFIQLTDLLLNSNLIINIEVLKDFNAPNLKMLNLSGNKISFIDAFSNISFLKIEELNLSMNSINKIEPLTKIKLSFIKGLFLNNNKISDISCLSNLSFKSLQRLYLNNNLIENINCLRKNPFPKLETLTLGGNKINYKDRNIKKILDDLEKNKVYINY